MAEASDNIAVGEDEVYSWKMLFQDNAEKVNDIESKPRI